MSETLDTVRASLFATPYKLSSGTSHGHRRGPFVTTECELFGYPRCWGAAAGSACTCPLFDMETRKPVSDEQHAACEADGKAACAERAGMPCDDCAFRFGSPEMRDELTLTVAMQRVPFRCHQGMPLRYVGNEDDGAPKVSYEPKDQLATTYPVCNGWAFYRSLGDDESRIDMLIPETEASR